MQDSKKREKKVLTFPDLDKLKGWKEAYKERGLRAAKREEGGGGRVSKLGGRLSFYVGR